MFEVPEWWSLIDRDAAIAEQFPPLEVVRRERPGGPLAKRLDAEHEQRKMLDRSRHVSRRREQAAEADAFIARMEATYGEARKRRRLNELDRERREIERELRQARRRLSHLNATANEIERRSA